VKEETEVGDTVGGMGCDRQKEIEGKDGSEKEGKEGWRWRERGRE
jgi:hypothetical protein